MPAVRSVEDGLVTDPAEPRLGLSHHPPAEWLPRMEAETLGVGFNPPIRMCDGLEVNARVDAGRWIACCPFCGVHSWVAPSDPRLFCTRCNNASVGCDWVHVRFPENRLELESILRVRPSKDQFWTAQTAVELMGENVGSGLIPYEGWL